MVSSAEQCSESSCTFKYTVVPALRTALLPTYYETSKREFAVSFEGFCSTSEFSRLMKLQVCVVAPNDRLWKPQEEFSSTGF